MDDYSKDHHGCFSEAFCLYSFRMVGINMLVGYHRVKKEQKGLYGWGILGKVRGDGIGRGTNDQIIWDIVGINKELEFFTKY